MKRLVLILISVLWLALPAAFAEDAVLYAIRENGLWGYMDRQGNMVIEPRYAFAEQCFTGKYCRAGLDTDYRQGVIDRQGDWVLPPEYSLCPMDHMGEDEEQGEGLLSVAGGRTGDRAEGFFDLDTGFFSGLKWYSVFPRYTDSALIAVRPGPEEHTGYADRRTGEEVLPPVYICLDPQLFYHGLALTAYESFENGYSDFFLMDEAGAVIPFPEGIRGDHCANPVCGRVAVRNDEDLLGFADLQGHIVIQPQYAEAFDYSEDRAVVRFADGDWGVIDPDGNMLVRGLEDVWGWKYKNGILSAVKDGMHIFYDRDGQELASFSSGAMPAGDDLYWVGIGGSMISYPDNWIWYLSDRDGYALSAPCFLTSRAVEDHDSFSEGLEPVGGLEHRWGYMDRQGRIAVECVYDRAEPFRFGLAQVEKDGRLMYIDRSGTVIWQEP
ncbi:MAG: WG repeat-containing protein [Clostridia bacterium]|nr:WG repeat-containing protein [Clostridia bacterium]